MKATNDRRWSEIRISDCLDGFWAVDAWKTADDNEEGKVIAYIDNLTARVLYLDPLGRVDKYAQEAIAEKVAEIRAENAVIVSENGREIRFKTAIGTLVAEIEDDARTGAGYDAVFIGMYPKDAQDEYFDVCGAIVEEQSSERECAVNVRAFADPSNDDATFSEYILESRIKEALNEFNCDTNFEVSDGQSEIAYKVSKGYLYVQESDDGYDYTLFDGGFNPVDGGRICPEDAEDNSILKAAKEIMILFGIDEKEAAPADPSFISIQSLREGE